jgi:hypothetical protein
VNTNTERLEWLINAHYQCVKWGSQYYVDGDYMDEFPGFFDSYAEAIDAAMVLAKEYEAAEWDNFICTAYDCPDKTLINDVFEVGARDIKEARRMAWNCVPHAMAMDVVEEEDDAL